MNRLVGEERGGILALSAFMIALFLVLTALVVDVGNWYTHKRQLQNKADAGALAAGYEYLGRLSNCDTAAANAITAVAKQYAGGAYNQTVNQPTNLTVRVNAASPTDPDWSDQSANPCQVHPTGDAWSPPNSIWTDVKVRETDVGTLFGGFGLDLLSVTAQARVEMKQLLGVRAGGLPLVNETGDQVDCAWAEFVAAGTEDPDDVTLLGGTPNPVPLTADSTTPRRFTAAVGGIDFTSADDIAVRYWMGTRKAGSCNYDPRGSNELAALSPDVPIDYINVYDNDTPGAANARPLLHHFQLTGVSCGGPGYLYTSSLDVNAVCTVNFRAEVDSGPNTHPTTITVSSSNSDVTPVSVAGSAGTGVRDYVGQLSFRPNTVDPSSTNIQSYMQVGSHDLSVSWRKTTGRIANRNCTPAQPCTGDFESGPCGSGCDETILHRTYVHDPLKSSPILSAELTTGGVPIGNSYPADGPNLGAFTIELTNYGIDQQRTFLLRDSVQNTGNRTHAIDCGQGNGTNALRDAVINGCPDPVGVNVRADACSPQPAPAGYRDCIGAIPGNRTALTQGAMARFSCSDPNNWVPGVSPANLNQSDPRYAYIFLTSWGRIVNSPSNAHWGGSEPNGVFPIRAFLRVYVTGWDRQGGGPQGPETCSSQPPGSRNEPPPEPYDGNGAALWGHFVDVITLEDDVIVGDSPCNLAPSLVTCKPTLVR